MGQAGLDTPDGSSSPLASAGESIPSKGSGPLSTSKNPENSAVL